MTLLHTLNSPALLETCLRAARAGDRLLLHEDGVYCAIDPDLMSRISELSVFALDDVLLARGLGTSLDSAVKPVSLAGFVGLCCEADKVINWF